MPGAPVPAALVAWILVLVLAGGRPWSVVEAILASAAILLCAFAFVHVEPGEGGGVPRWASAWLVGAIALCAAHLLPLPPGTWSATPLRDGLAQALVEAGVAPRWRSWTLDPALGAMRLLSLAAPVSAAVWLARLPARVDTDAIARMLLGVAIVAALVGVVTSLAGPGLDLHRGDMPMRAGARGTFSNPNHLATFIAMALPLALALAARAGPRPVAFAWAGACGLLFVALLATRSRAGVVLGIAAALAMAMPLAARWLRTGRGTGWVAGLSAFALLAVVAAASLGVLRRFQPGLVAEQETAGGRLALLRGLPPLDDAPIGLGAFEQWYASAPGNAVVDVYVNHLHNDWVELWIELGWPFAVLAVAAVAGLAFAMRGALRRAAGDGHQRALVQALLLGIGVAGLHSLVDYPLRTTANLTLLACLVTALLRAGRPARHPVPSPVNLSSP